MRGGRQTLASTRSMHDRSARTLVAAPIEQIASHRDPYSSRNLYRCRAVPQFAELRIAIPLPWRSLSRQLGIRAHRHRTRNRHPYWCMFPWAICAGSHLRHRRSLRLALSCWSGRELDLVASDRSLRFLGLTSSFLIRGIASLVASPIALGLLYDDRPGRCAAWRPRWWRHRRHFAARCPTVATQRLPGAPTRPARQGRALQLRQL